MSAPDPARALLARPKHGAGLGLHRMLAARDALGRAHEELRRLDAIKITGSNGKGSVCAMVAAILGAVDVRVGLYTSPHLHRVHERIVVDGRPIGDDELRRSHAWFEALRAEHLRAHPGDDFGAFEAMTAVALHRFARAEVETVVAEAGIGGRYDATRVIPGRTCGLVSVDLEHTALLGGTEEQIAFDKADLCPPGGTLVVGRLHAELRRRLEAYGRLRTVAVQGIDERARVEVVAEGLPGTTVRLWVDELVIPELVIPAAGRHQVDNAALAVALAHDWLRRHRPGLAPDRLVAAIQRAFGGLRLPGRLELVGEDPPAVIDVGHTPAAVASVARTLAPLLGPAKAVLVVGVSHDREPEALLGPLVPLAAHVICTRAHHRGGDPARVEAVLAERWPGVPRRVEATIEAAMRRAVEMARAQGRTVVVAGGLFVAMEAKAVLCGRDPQAIAFL